MGIGLAIDDFGTSYSNFSFLKNFPVDKVKMDLRFVNLAERSAKDIAISCALITLAHSMGSKVTAEGVENETHLALLSARGCDEVQGFYFSPPLPAEDCAPMLRKKHVFPRRGKMQSEHGGAIILQVAKEPQSLNGLAGNLTSSGHRVLVAAGGCEALNLLALHEVGVIICAEQLLDMPGAEFLGKVRRLHSSTTRMMIAEEASVTLLVQAINQGAVFRFLQNPWDPQELRTMVSDALIEHENRKWAAPAKDDGCSLGIKQ